MLNCTPLFYFLEKYLKLLGGKWQFMVFSPDLIKTLNLKYLIFNINGG